jgi:hypothetical protein
MLARQRLGAGEAAIAQGIAPEIRTTRAGWVCSQSAISRDLASSTPISAVHAASWRAKICRLACA